MAQQMTDTNSTKYRKQPLTIYMLKDGTKAPEEALENIRTMSSLDVAVAGTKIGTLYFKATTPRPPSWLSFFRDAIDLNGFTGANASTAAALLISRNEKLFAVTFGYGWKLIRPGVFEENFGLRVALNVLDPRKIRSVDRTTFDAIAQHSQIQASKESPLEEFGLDVEQDLVRAVTGTSEIPELGVRLAGKDSLHAVAQLPLSGLPKLLDRYAEEYAKTGYRERYPWIDQVQEVKDQRVGNLNDALVVKIRKEDFDNIWLAVPELINWREIHGFRYSESARKPLVDDLHIRDFLAEVRNIDSITVDFLKRRHGLSP
jgi:uncharacterized protein (TIGR04141 family)